MVAPQNFRVLDVGCGDKKMAGAIGIDSRAVPGVDIVHDLERYPWPLSDDCFDLIICSHIIEHLGDVRAFLLEVHRVAAAGARVRIDTPHFSSLDSWTDPSHRQHLALRSFDFFTDGGYLNGGRIFRVERLELTFRKNFLSQCGQLIYRWSPDRYEKNFSYLIPARDIRAQLVVVK